MHRRVFARVRSSELAISREVMRARASRAVASPCTAAASRVAWSSGSRWVESGRARTVERSREAESSAGERKWFRSVGGSSGGFLDRTGKVDGATGVAVSKDSM